MSPTRCNPIWPLCIHEFHAIAVGFLAGLLFAILLRRSAKTATTFLIVVVALAWVAPVHGILKPWYVLGGLLVSLGLAKTVRYITD